jgi:hypothetical protein
MQKHKFGVTCPDALFMKTDPSPPEHEKYCVDVSHPDRAGMHYLTRRFHRMQKHMFGVMCPGTLFLGTSLSHPSLKNSASTFRAPVAPLCTT